MTTWEFALVYVLRALSLIIAFRAYETGYAFAGLVTPVVAALAMSGSSISVTLNALRAPPALEGGDAKTILLVLVPLALSLGGLGLAAFLWLLRGGQYDDLEGAVVRVLSDDDLAPLPRPLLKAAAG